MYDVSHVGFVDPHAERDGRHDRLNAVLNEIILSRFTFVVAQPSVVRQRAIAGLVKLRGDLFHIGTPDTIDNPRVVGITCNDFGNLGQPIVAAFDPIDQIGTVERPHEKSMILQLELPGDVFADRFGRGGGISMEGRLGKQFAKRFEFAIFGTEVVSPIR